MPKTRKSRAQLLIELDALRAACIEGQRAGQTLQEITVALQERVKELNCLYSLSQLAQENDLSLEELLRASVELLPPAWQYPSQASACIRVGNLVFCTANWGETGHEMAAEIVVQGKSIGDVRVRYPKSEAVPDTEPFLPEEYRLLRVVAEMLSRTISRRQAEKALAQQSQELARSTAELQRFAYAVSHQMQELLRTVALHTQMLARNLGPSLPPALRETMGYVIDGVARMQQLLNDLLADLQASRREGAPLPGVAVQTPATAFERDYSILLVEDNPGDVNLVREALAESPLRARLQVARDGAEALALLRREAPYAEAARPDLILLDLNLPRKSGHEVLQEIRRDPALRRIPVVVLSSSPAQSDIARSYEIGANCYIVKPFTLDRFLSTVRAIGDFWCGMAELPK